MLVSVEFFFVFFNLVYILNENYENSIIQKNGASFEKFENFFILNNDYINSDNSLNNQGEVIFLLFYNQNFKY